MHTLTLGSLSGLGPCLLVLQATRRRNVHKCVGFCPLLSLVFTSHCCLQLSLPQCTHVMPSPLLQISLVPWFHKKTRLVALKWECPISFSAGVDSQGFDSRTVRQGVHIATELEVDDAPVHEQLVWRLYRDRSSTGSNSCHHRISWGKNHADLPHRRPTRQPTLIHAIPHIHTETKAKDTSEIRGGARAQAGETMALRQLGRGRN